MRLMIAVLFTLVNGAAFALDTARALAAAGANHLALARVEALQPRELAAPRWAEWEALRIRLLVAVRRDEEALRRADALPPDLPPHELRSALMAAAHAATVLGRGALARRYLARVIWQHDPSADDLRTARRLVIDTWLAEREGRSAFLAMLRFQQDYSPLDSSTAERFVAGLLALGMEREAVNWLAALDDAGPTKLRLRLRLGLIEPAAAVKQARARLAKGGEAEFWAVLVDAAAPLNDPVLRLEGFERLLNAGSSAGAMVPAATPRQLREAYAAAAAELAKRHRLPAGEDAAWVTLAQRQTAGPATRALHAHLADHAREPRARSTAQRELVQSLQRAGLERTALELFADGEASGATLDAAARRALADIAERRGRFAVALRYREGLPPPPGMTPEEWQVRLAALYLRSARDEEAQAVLRQLSEAGRPLPADAARLLGELAQEMVGTGKPRLADGMLPMLLAGGGTRARRDLLFELGQTALRRGDARAASGYYLRSAVLADGKAPDAPALQARLAAARALAQAGFRDDARVQFEWVVRHAQDAAQAEVARRELSKL